jgi:hypothetical protein
MFRPTKLTLTDEKILTAKALAFDVFVLHERVWLTDHAEAVERLEQFIDGFGSLAVASDSTVDLEEFLNHGIAFIETSLGPVLGDDSPLLAAYVSHLKQSRKKWCPISTQAEQWLGSMLELGRKYLDQCSRREVTVPKVRLYSDMQEKSSPLQGLGGKTDEEGGERVIWIFYFPPHFRLESYFSIPYVLSHELWCHVLSGLASGGGRTKGKSEIFGCSPRNIFEEGWMDYVQFKILEKEMETVLGESGRIAAFQDRSEAFHQLRNSRAGYRPVRYGALAARQFHGFLELYAEQLKVSDPDALFFQISIDLNLLQGLTDAKCDLVVELGRVLGVFAPEERGRASIERNWIKQIEGKRGLLANEIGKALKNGHLSPAEFFKILRIKGL